MENIVDQLRIESTSDCVAFTEFILQYKKGEDKLYCFFEGYEDRTYYSIRIESLSNTGGYCDFICGGKDDVIKVHNLIKDNSHYQKVKTGFFIDSDFDNYTLPNSLYQTPTYSIENLYCKKESFEKILIAEFKMKRTDQDFIKCIENYLTLINKFSQEILLLNAWLACQADIRKANKTSTRLNIDKKVKAFFEKIVISDLSDIKSFDGLKTKLELQTLYNEAPLVDDLLLEQKQNELAVVNSMEKFRGKFLLKFLESYLNKLQSVFGTANSPFLKKYSCSLRIEYPTICSNLSQYAETPPCLKKYISYIS